MVRPIGVLGKKTRVHHVGVGGIAFDPNRHTVIDKRSSYGGREIAEHALRVGGNNFLGGSLRCFRKVVALARNGMKAWVLHAHTDATEGPARLVCVGGFVRERVKAGAVADACADLRVHIVATEEGFASRSGGSGVELDVTAKGILNIHAILVGGGLGGDAAGVHRVEGDARVAQHVHAVVDGGLQTVLVFGG